MRYKSATNIISIILLLFAVSIFFVFIQGRDRYIFILPFAIVGIGLFVFKSPIDKYFFRFQDVGFTDKIEGMLKIEYPVIQSYSAEKQKEFFDRLFYFMYEREFYLVKEDSEELDLYYKLIIAAPGVILSMDGPVDEANDVQRIAAYNHAFPSPKMKFIHSAEYDEVDGVIILSLEQIIMSQRMPDKYFPITYFMWAERKVAQNEDFPQIPESFPGKFDEIWGFSRESAEQFLGYELRNHAAVSLCAYQLRKDKMMEHYPNFTKHLENYMRT